MKREIISFKVEQPKRRMHQVLFAEDSPFKPKRVERKDGYRRKAKHRTREFDT
jgi:hypothetical protein